MVVIRAKSKVPSYRKFTDNLDFSGHSAGIKLITTIDKGKWTLQAMAYNLVVGIKQFWHRDWCTLRGQNLSTHLGKLGKVGLSQPNSSINLNSLWCTCFISKFLLQVLVVLNADNPNLFAL